jgi:hypothetical protein
VTSRDAAPDRAGPLADGTGGLLIALVFGFAGPPIGAVAVAPLAALAEGQVMPSALLGGLWLLLATFPFGILMTYYEAGLVALCIGIVIAAVARRRGKVPLLLTAGAASTVLLAFLLVSRLAGVTIPGAAVVDEAGSTSVPILVAAAIAASLLCALATRPVQKRCR